MQQLALLEPLETAPTWHVRESRRARRLSLRVYRNGAVEVVVPLRTRPGLIESFVARHRDWIETKRNHARAQPVDPFPPARLELTGIGESWLCVPGARQARALRSSAGVSGGACLELPGRIASTALPRALRTWLAARAGRGFAPQLQALATQMNLRYDRLQIRWQRSRWGSCSARGTVSLNGALLFQRPEVVRYLLVHELAHLKHMNHSPRFWSLVEQYEPDWRRLDRELLAGWARVPTWLQGAGPDATA